MSALQTHLDNIVVIPVTVNSYLVTSEGIRSSWRLMTCSGSLTKQVAELVAMVTISKHQFARMDLRIPGLALAGPSEH